MRARLLALLLVGPALTGCLGGDEAEPTSTGGSGPAQPPAPTPPTVIAVPDTGVNPYHEAFRGGPTFEQVAGVPDDARALNLTFDADSYQDAVEADADLWDSVETGELVWFPGTRLAAISVGAAVNDSAPEPVGQDVRDPRAPILDEDGHGTLTSHSTLAAGPDTVVVMVQTPDDESLADVMPWIADQAWIDLVSVSWGTWSFEYAQGETRMDLPSAYRQAYRSGKLILNGAGNEPIPHVVSEHPGPPFVIGVGGSEDATHGETEIAAKLPDIVSTFTQRRAEAGTLDGYTVASGTSLSTPYAAGAIGQALHQVRVSVDANRTGADPLVAVSGPGALEDGALTKEELWSAVNATAIQWGPSDWEPTTEPEGVGYGLPIAHPAIQQGWGHVGPNVTGALTGELLGTGDPPAKSPGTAEIIGARLEVQRAFWASPAGQPPPDGLETRRFIDPAGG